MIVVAWLRRLMGAPLFEDDEDRTRAAGLLNIVLWTLLAAAVVADVATLVVVPA